VVTNNHVIAGASGAQVRLADGRAFAAQLVGTSPDHDLAVLRIRVDADRPSPLPIGTSKDLKVGQDVLAVGNPFGLDWTLTTGIVSALNRELPGEATGIPIRDLIQTDAAINPGNSGGALVDLQGRLVGINTAIFSRSGGSVGIGFAIPANMARIVGEAGISGGALVRPWFGARLQEVTSDIASGLGLDRVRGAIVTEIAPGGPAERAGFKTGDVILSADGFAINQPSAFDFRLATRKLGSEVTIDYLRGGQEGKITLKLEGAPGGDAKATASLDGDTRFAGVTVETVNPAIAQELGLPFNAHGVVVRSVAQGSPAQRMGLTAGDVILNLNGRDMTDAKTFRDTASARPEGWQIVLQRGGRTFRSFVSG